MVNVANYKDYLFDVTKKIMSIDSPSGYYWNVTEEVRRIVEEMG